MRADGRWASAQVQAPSRECQWESDMGAHAAGHNRAMQPAASSAVYYIAVVRASPTRRHTPPRPPPLPRALAPPRPPPPHRAERTASAAHRASAARRRRQMPRGIGTWWRAQRRLPEAQAFALNQSAHFRLPPLAGLSAGPLPLHVCTTWRRHAYRHALGGKTEGSAPVRRSRGPSSVTTSTTRPLRGAPPPSGHTATRLCSAGGAAMGLTGGGGCSDARRARPVPGGLVERAGGGCGGGPSTSSHSIR